MPENRDIEVEMDEHVDIGDDDVDDDGVPYVDHDALREEYGVEPEVKRTVMPLPSLKAVVRQGFMDLGHILDLPQPGWFIKDLIPVGPVTIVHGPSGGKKSFLLLDWMLCAATGTDWHHHDVAPGKVLYIVAEGVYGTGKRIRAWAAQHKIKPDNIRNTYWVKWPINFYKMEPEHLAHWNAVIRALGIKYVVVDTLHMSISGADENSSQDMGKVFSNARHLARPAQLFFVHHDPKDTTNKSARGSGTIRDDADVVLTFKEREKGSPVSVLTSDKIKDGPPFKQALHVAFAEWEGVHEHSLYVESVTGGDVVKGDRPLSAVDKCAEAITEHDLLALGFGAGRMNEELRNLDLGYKWSEATVGKALRQLRVSEHEVDQMNRKRDVT
jgi:hypothetical protein